MTVPYTTNGNGGNGVDDEFSDFDDIACCLCKCAVDFGDASFFLPPTPALRDNERVDDDAVAGGTVTDEDNNTATDMPLKEINATLCAGESTHEENDRPIVTSDGVAMPDVRLNLGIESEKEAVLSNEIQSSHLFEERKRTDLIRAADMESKIPQMRRLIAKNDVVLAPPAVLPTATSSAVHRDKVYSRCNEGIVKKVLVTTEVDPFELSDEKKETDDFVEAKAERKMPPDGHRVVLKGDEGTVSSFNQLTDKCPTIHHGEPGSRGVEVFLTTETRCREEFVEKKETENSEKSRKEIKVPLSGLEILDDDVGGRVLSTDQPTEKTPPTFDGKVDSKNCNEVNTPIDATRMSEEERINEWKQMNPPSEELFEDSNDKLNQSIATAELSSSDIAGVRINEVNSSTCQAKGGSIKKLPLLENVKNKKENDIDSKNINSNPLPRLPQRFYDPDNALILCDGPTHAGKRRNSKGEAYICERAYHQRCHFIPVFSIPRGPWRCLICRYRDEEYLKQKASAKGRKGNGQSKRAIGKDQKLDGIPAETLTDDELNSIFRCPPQLPTSANRKSSRSVDVVSTELKFERVSAPLKAKILHAELTLRAKAFINKSLSNIRVAEHSIRAFTESSKARKLLLERMETMDGRLPQELVQCVFKIAYAKKRIRDFIMSIRETIKRRSLHGRIARGRFDENINCVDVTNDLMQWYLSCVMIKEGDPSGDRGGTDILKFLFPEGHTRRRREEPRTAEANGLSNASASHASDSSGVSLDDLKCTCCNEGHSSNENDLLLCDGENCYRAFHMHCLEPKLTPEELASDENDNWFCPLCSAHAMLVHFTQREVGQFLEQFPISLTMSLAYLPTRVLSCITSILSI